MSVNKKIDFGVKAFVIRDGKFLVMHNNGEKRDLWELPGGRMQFGENAEQTLKREMMEETGLEVGFSAIGTHSFFMGQEEQTDFIMRKDL